MKLKKLALTLVAPALMLNSCLTEPDFEPIQDGAIPINLDGSIDQTQTKVNAQGFEDGDGLGLYAVNYENDNQTPGVLLDKGNQVDHVKYVFDEKQWKWKPVRTVYYHDINTNVDLYAFYPHAEPSSVSAYNFEVQKDQSTPRRSGKLGGYESSDFLWGKSVNVVPNESAIKVKLHHMMAGVQIVIKEGTGFEVAGDFALLDKKVIVTNTTRKASINLATGQVTPVGAAQATGIVMAPQSDGSFRAVVVPQSVDAGTQLFSITIEGVTYSFKKDVSYEYVSGKLSQFTITVNRKTHSGEYELILDDTQIVDWKEDLNTHEGEARQYYCVYCEEPGTLGRVIKASNKNPDKIKNLKVSGNIQDTDFYFMKDSMALLQSVNLKETVIHATENNFENEIPSNALYQKTNLVNFVFPKRVDKIGHGAFYGCILLSGAMIIPDGVKEIDDFAFDGCATLSSLVLPVGLERIGTAAFHYCKSLSGSLMLPESLTTIGSNAFYGCSGFSGSLLLPENLSILESNAFTDCSGFTGDLKIPESLKSIASGTFKGCSGLEGQLIMHDNLQLFDGYSGAYYMIGYNGSIFEGCNFQGELKLPSSLTYIPNWCFQGNDFSSIAELPEGLLGIGHSAFYDCSRLGGKLEFPESLVLLDSYAFSGCSQLQEIILPSKLDVIGDCAFNGCVNISKIVCRAEIPPILKWNAFSSVPKDNFTVEVPEKSVDRYRTDSQWGEFKRIAAHQDFSISRPRLRALNAAKSKNFVLRAPAGFDWSIESKPEWVNVVPSSGTGKTEVTISIAEMTEADVSVFDCIIDYDGYNYNTRSYDGRAGEIVFLLEDKDYRTTMKVEQFDYEYSDGDVVKLNTATKGNGVNLVFLADCYDAKDITDGAYLADIQEAYSYYFDVEPYKTYKDYFNVYAVFGESEESGMGTVNTIREAKFGSQYSLDGISPDFATCYEYAQKADNNLIPAQTLVVLVENTTDYGGICYMWGDGTAIACCPKSRDAYPYDFRGIVQHEAGGHGFGKLADEYIYHNAFIETCTCICCQHLDDLLYGKSLGWYRNIEVTSDMHEVGWSHMIFNPQYSDVVGIYEGGFYHSRGVYRSEPTSCMNNNIPYYSAISRQAIVERIMDYAGEEFDLEDFYAKDSNELGSTRTRSFVEDMQVVPLYDNGKQNAPVYMGMKPDFLK